MNEIETCSICKGDIEHKEDDNGKVYWTSGNNAEPVNDGRCCDICNAKVVLPARLFIIEKEKEYLQNIKARGGQDE